MYLKDSELYFPSKNMGMYISAIKWAIILNQDICISTIINHVGFLIKIFHINKSSLIEKMENRSLQFHCLNLFKQYKFETLTIIKSFYEVCFNFT